MCCLVMQKAIIMEQWNTGTAKEAKIKVKAWSQKTAKNKKQV